MKPPLWNWVRTAFLLLSLVYLVGWFALSYRAMRGEAVFWSFLPALLGPAVIAFDFLSARSVNGRIRGFLGPAAWTYQTFDEAHPDYRFADYFYALERCAAQSARADRLNCENVATTLRNLLQSINLAAPTPATQKKTCVGYERNVFLPGEAIWFLEGPPGLAAGERVVARLSTVYGVGVKVEIACRAGEPAMALLHWLNRDALAQSIFRGQFLEIRYDHAAHPDYDSYHVAGGVTIVFKPKPGVGDDNIILDDRTRAILGRTVFDFFAHRDSLHAYGLPLKRALLFYGPPGTGKTHTCRYVHARLGEVTSILVAGNALVRLQDIGQFARQLHPCLVVIEDVDLVFTSREVNPYGTALGELMDQLDGFTPDEEVLFILTTNAIERVEEAIRDRPGRINQCLHFDLPKDELRRLFLVQYLRPYDTSAVDFDHLVRQTERTSQAFLKEYVLRAVQVAAESIGYAKRPTLALQTAHFDAAFDELTSHGDLHGHAIIGFRVGGR